jgi:GntR family transcriptional regulator, vanillate catabolism transcriptional regulator
LSTSDSHIGRTVVRLREMILKGDFQAGERISELPLVAMLGVSRTPIRLALERLAHEGLLEPYPTGGFIVRGFTLDDVWDSIEVRGTLEGIAARMAAERVTGEADVDALREYQRQMDAIGEPPTTDAFPTYLEVNDAFHAEIVRLANSPMLRLTLDRLFCLPFAGPSALVISPLLMPSAPEGFRTGNEHHHLLIDAIASRHGTFAESLAREHARLTRRHLEQALNDKDFLASVPGGQLISLASAGL